MEITKKKRRDLQLIYSHDVTCKHSMLKMLDTFAISQ